MFNDFIKWTEFLIELSDRKLIVTKKDIFDILMACNLIETKIEYKDKSISIVDYFKIVYNINLHHTVQPCLILK